MEMVHFIPPSQRRLAMLAAQADAAPVLIHGGNGTGKGAIARWIHLNGPRSTGPFMSADRKRSLAEQIPLAQGGTLEIQEIGEWGLAEQRILLDYLQTKSVAIPERPGMRRLANARIMATTSQALDGRAQGGLFNAELLEKLNVFRLEMPALAKRADEFEDIVQGITGEITRELHKEHLRSIEPDAWKRLREYDWPGNVRELRNVLRLAIVSAQGDRILASDFPEFGHNRLDFRSTREQFEKTYIVELLKTFHWDLERTCRMAKMDRPTMIQKITQYGIELPKTRSSSEKPGPAPTLSP